MKQSIGLFEKPEDGDERGVESYNFERAKDDTRYICLSSFLMWERNAHSILEATNI